MATPDVQVLHELSALGTNNSNPTQQKSQNVVVQSTQTAVVIKNLAPPSFRNAEFWSCQQSKRAILKAVDNYVEQITHSTDSESERKTQLDALISGSSQLGFVSNSRSGRIKTVEELRSLIMALQRRQGLKFLRVGTDREEVLFMFYVPKGYISFAGEVSTSLLIEKAIEEDLRRGWTRSPEDTFTPGPCCKELLKKLDITQRIAQLPVYGRDRKTRVGTEYKLFPHTSELPQKPSRIISFVLTYTGEFVTWQAGRYVWGMGTDDLVKRTIITSK